MIAYLKGNIFEAPAQVVTNAVNCVGVMGGGIALQFKERYPDMFRDYAARCESGDVSIGKPYLFENDTVQILNFPTKRDWRENSTLEDIEAGLQHLQKNYGELGIYSVALPALGCGLGGLEWNDVKPLIEKYLGNLPDLDVLVYEPLGEADKKPRRAGSKAGVQDQEGIAAQSSLF